MLQATKDLKQVLQEIQQAQSECISEYGYIKSECRYKYQMLVRQAQALRESISWLDRTYTNTV